MAGEVQDYQSIGVQTQQVYPLLVRIVMPPGSAYHVWLGAGR
jgi:hypothetical protein